MRTRIIFVGLSVVLLGLVAWAAFKDSSSRDLHRRSSSST